MAEGQEERLKLVFMGTPEFARVILQHVLAWPGGRVAAVYTQPDRPCGRGQVCQPTPVKALALEHGLPVFQPLDFKAAEDVEKLKELEPDYLLVAAYGLILPRSVLDIPRLGALNVHTSLLPKYRGAAPIQRALQAGERVTGVTVMRMAEGLDSGPILLQRSLMIGDADTAETLHDQLADLGGRLLAETLERARTGKLADIPQDEAKATYARKLSKEEGLIDFDRPARQVHDHVRAMHSWPGAYVFADLPGQKKPLRLTLIPGRLGPAAPDGVAPGTLLGLQGDALAFACQDRLYLVDAVKPEGKRLQTAQEFACGYLSRACQ